MDNKKLPKAIHESIIKLGDIELKVFVFDTGERIIEKESVEKFFEYLAGGGLFTEEEAIELAKFTKEV